MKDVSCEELWSQADQIRIYDLKNLVSEVISSQQENTVSVSDHLKLQLLTYSYFSKASVSGGTLNTKSCVKTDSQSGPAGSEIKKKTAPISTKKRLRLRNAAPVPSPPCCRMKKDKKNLTSVSTRR